VQRDSFPERATFAPCLPRAVLVAGGKCAMVRFFFAVAAAFFMLRRAAAFCFDDAIRATS